MTKDGKNLPARGGFPEPAAKLAIAPSVLSADFRNLEKSLSRVKDVSDWLHFDVMDGAFVPNISFGPGLIPAVSDAGGHLPVDAHLMIKEPLKYIEAFAEAGAGLITVHEEAAYPLQALSEIKKAGLKAGISIRPKTPAAALIPYMEFLDLILVMTVEPGFGGQSFMADQLPKIAVIRGMIKSSGRGIWLQADGGINRETAKLAVRAGADALVMGSAVFRAPDPERFITDVRKDCAESYFL